VYTQSQIGKATADHIELSRKNGRNPTENKAMVTGWARAALEGLMGMGIIEDIVPCAQCAGLIYVKGVAFD
jgi:hypothetical protein